MKRIVNVICAFDLIFLLLLVLSSFIVNDIASETIYYLAFIIPILIGAYYLKREKPFTENADTVYLSCDKGSFGYFMPIAFPAIAMIIFISYITSFVMGAFGIESNAEISVSLPEALLVYALVPAVLEEALFRFIPLKLLLPYSKKWAIILSASGNWWIIWMTARRFCGRPIWHPRHRAKAGIFSTARQALWQ